MIDRLTQAGRGPGLGRRCGELGEQDSEMGTKQAMAGRKVGERAGKEKGLASGLGAELL